MIKTISNSANRSSNKRSRTVRKTITIDGDLAQEIGLFVLEKGASEKTVINNLIRAGLIQERKKAEQVSEFRLPSFKKGIGDISRQELNVLLDEI